MPSSLLVCLAEGFVDVGPGPLVDCFGTAFSRWFWLFGLLVARADFPVLLIRFVQLSFMAVSRISVPCLPELVRIHFIGWFNCLATKISFAEIVGASVFPPWLVWSVSVPFLSVSFRSVAR